MRVLVAAAVLSVIDVANASAQGFANWYFHYIQGDEAGDLTSCSASIDFNNAWFSARLSGEYLDFVYHRDDFTLPFDQVFGSVIFRIDKAAYTLTASTNSRHPSERGNTTQTLFFEPRLSDQGSIFRALRNGRTFWIEFPNEDYYEFPLLGSGRAFQLASDCWSSRPTGPFSNNPFTPNVSGNNPFDNL